MHSIRTTLARAVANVAFPMAAPLSSGRVNRQRHYAKHVMSTTEHSGVMPESDMLADSAWPFVARSEELELLMSAIAAGTAAAGQPAGAVVVGPAGVGKTRLLAHARAVAAQQGNPVHTVIGTRAGQRTPYAALAHLAPAGKAAHADVGALYREYAAALGGDGARPLLVVDDAHLLDAGSAGLVLHLAVTGTVTVLIGIRRGEPVADPITALWKDELALRVDLQNFSGEETAALIRRALGGDVDTRTARLLAQTSGGNPLYIRELIRGTLAAGALRRDGGIWSWDGRLALAPRLADVIGQRLDGLSAAEADALGIVALGEPLALGVAEALIDNRVLARLEAIELVTVAGDGCRLSHPLYGDVALARLGAVATRRLTRALADGVQAHGSGSDEQVLRVATWRLDAGGKVSAASLAHAAVLANRAFDDQLAERLARAAIERGAGPRAQVSLARALTRQRRFDEAEALLAGVEDTLLQQRRNDPQLLHGYLDTRFFALFEGLGRDRQAAAMLDRFAAAHDDLDEPHRVAARHSVAAHRAKLALEDGALREAIVTVSDVLEAREPEAATLVDALQTAAEATAYLGGTDRARVLQARLVELAATGRPELASAGSMAALQEMLYQLLEGRIADLLPVVTGFYEQLITSRDALARGLAALSAGATQLLQGTVQSARQALGDAVHAFGTAQIADHLPWALALRCQAEALAGDLEAARRSQADSKARRVRRGTPRAHCDFVLADALTQAAAGDPTGAARTCIEGAGRLPELRLHAARLLHTAARLGAAPGPLAGSLAEIADAVQCPLPRLQADHVVALAAGDGPALDAIAERFEQLGMWLIGAEAAAQASASYSGAARRQAASRAAIRSAELAGRCEGARTPALALPSTLPRLSRREREVAALAADGLPNATIAARLTLSTRTVESHLYQAFAKLGVARREDLAAALRTRGQPV